MKWNTLLRIRYGHKTYRRLVYMRTKKVKEKETDPENQSLWVYERRRKK